MIVFPVQANVTSLIGLFEFHGLVADGRLLFIEDSNDVVDGSYFILVFSDDFDSCGIGVPVGDILELTEIFPNGFEGSRNLDVELELDHWRSDKKLLYFLRIWMNLK